MHGELCESIVIRRVRAAADASAASYLNAPHFMCACNMGEHTEAGGKVSYPVLCFSAV